MQMSTNNWDKAKELFEAALELDPSQRASFLAENCPEASLQQQVEKWLIDYQAAGSFLDKPALHSGGETAETEDPMISRRLGAYKLVRRLGQGGMAAVFLAVRADDEYHKEVAVKLARPGLDSQDVLSRFRKERQTLAVLDHPNIVTLLDGGSTPEGWPFLVMDYVKGTPIDNYCDQHKLSVDDRLRLFGRVCEAVQYAHEKLVIHRDLKPSNILVLPDGTPKLLDFGIAKVLNPELGNQDWLATQTGLRCMTPAYATPEQARGEPVTAEADVYSLGVVLYELLTGHRPYRLTQNSPAEIERAICEQEPETPSTAISRVENDTSPDGKPITKTPELVSLTRGGEPDKLRRRLRGDLDNIVLKSLQKDPLCRYGSVAEFSQDIDRHLQHQPVKARPSILAYRVSKFVQRHRTEFGATLAVVLVTFAAVSFAFNAAGIRDPLGTGSSQTKIRSLAVIPLTNTSGDPTQEYFADGMTDALITDLAQISDLKVTSRTSSMQYKQTKKSLPEIARELNVDAIVEGTVQRSADRVLITVQLLHAASDKPLWAKGYDRDVRDAFALERGLAQEIVDRVQFRIGAGERSPLRRSEPANYKALDAYLRGNYYLYRSDRNVSDNEKRTAAKYFQQSIDADPEFARAYIGLANAHAELSLGSIEDTVIRKRAAERALALDSNSAEAWEILGHLKWYAFEWTEAEKDYRRAVALNPNRASYICGLGTLLAATGRLDEALKEGEISQALDPNEDRLSPILEMRGEHKRAIELLHRMVELHPDDAGYHFLLFRNYTETGMSREAVPELERTFTVMGFPKIAADLHRAFAASGYRGAMRVFAKALEDFDATGKGFFPEALAYAHLALGDKDRAFYWLEQAYKRRENVSADWGLMIIKEDHLLDPLRSDPRFGDLMRLVGLPEEQASDLGASRNGTDTTR